MQRFDPADQALAVPTSDPNNSLSAQKGKANEQSHETHQSC